MLDPVSVALKFGFLVVLYLFLLWVARSASKDLRRPVGAPAQAWSEEATGMHAASQGLGPRHDPVLSGEPRLQVEQGPGLQEGSTFDLSSGAVLGRGEFAEIRLDDQFASSRHARISWEGALPVIEDLGSTNGTYLNDEPLSGPQPLHSGDRIRIGDTEFSYLP